MTDLTPKVLRILNESAVRKIDFGLGGLRINGDHFAELRLAIGQGRAHVIHYPGHRYPAEYFADRDVMVLQSDAMGERYERTHPSMYERSFVVHEAAHAVMDMIRAKPTRQLAGEAAAYLAQALYLYEEMGRDSYKHWIDEGSFPVDIHRACFALIERRHLDRGGVTLSDADYKPIMRAIKANKAYRDTAWTDLLDDAAGLAPPPAPPAGGCGCSMIPVGASPRARYPALGGQVRVPGVTTGVDPTTGLPSLAAPRPTLRSRTPTVPPPQWTWARTSATSPQAGGAAFPASPVPGVPGARSPVSRTDPYSGAMWQDLSRVRPTHRVEWMQTHRPLAYQQHRANVDLLHRAVQRQLTPLRVDPYSSAMLRDLSRIRPDQRVGWMSANHPLAYQQHRADVRLLGQAATQQLR